MEMTACSPDLVQLLLTVCKEEDISWDYAQTGAVTSVAMTRYTVLHWPSTLLRHTMRCSMRCMQAAVAAFLLTDCFCCGCSVLADSGQAILQT